MKIKELRFKNLNSLYGEWFIDFTDPEYVSNGIFALTGPTGAGKSTILDAICLALYGTTPRLGKITKSSNDIISRQAGDCYAEVVFESQTGCYRCRWDQRRAKRKPGGALQSPEHQISHASSGDLIESKLSLVKGVVEAQTGMDFERFTRSILLAQGGFDKFLKADVEQKSKTLEQITGTAIYSDISILVHERQKSERQKIDLLRAATNDPNLLEAEQENETKRHLSESQVLNKKIEGDLTKIRNEIQWLKGVRTLEKEFEKVLQDLAKVTQANEEFKDDRSRMERSGKAAAIEAQYVTFAGLRSQQVKDIETCDICEKRLPQLEAEAKRQEVVLTGVRKQLEHAKEEQSAAVPIIRAIRELDQKIEGKRRETESNKAIIGGSEKELDQQQEKVVRFQNELAAVDKDYGQAQEYLKEHVTDEWLVSGLGGLEVKLQLLGELQQEVDQQKVRLSKSESENKLAIETEEASKTLFKVKKRKLSDFEKRLQDETKRQVDLLGNESIGEHRGRKDTLLRRLALIRSIGELEEQRKNLVDGKECSLCGSKEHPYAEGNVPVPDATELEIELLTNLISKSEEFERKITELKESLNITQHELSEIGKKVSQIESQNLATDKAIEEMKQQLQKKLHRINDLSDEVQSQLQPLGILEIASEDSSSILKSLKVRLQEWQLQIKAKEQVSQCINELKSKLKSLEAVIANQTQELEKKRIVCEKGLQESELILAERTQSYGLKQPDVEEACYKKAIDELEKTKKLDAGRFDGLQRDLTGSRDKVEFLAKQISDRKIELESSGACFIDICKSSGFADEGEFLAARLSADEFFKLTQRAKQLDGDLLRTDGQRMAVEARLAEEREKNKTEQLLDVLNPQLDGVEQDQKQGLEKFAALKMQLNLHDRAKKAVQEKQLQIDIQTTECGRWGKLHSLIGSADGKKFRAFAQGLTLQLMIKHANCQLTKMSDRYELVRDLDQPLELSVVDQYQAGEVRSTKNLSGGESFIVSLALALGLSKMASQKVRVDSLFLDEGFGTLDENALETALETLSGLHEEGKLIGIISHIPALKERIGTQISILPSSTGRSEVTGPGVKKI